MLKRVPFGVKGVPSLLKGIPFNIELSKELPKSETRLCTVRLPSGALCRRSARAKSRGATAANCARSKTALSVSSAA